MSVSNSFVSNEQSVSETLRFFQLLKLARKMRSQVYSDCFLSVFLATNQSDPPKNLITVSHGTEQDATSQLNHSQ